MKIKSLLCAALIAAFSSIAFAQNAVVTTRKVTYKRPKPVSDYKKNFVVNYPTVKGLSPAITKRLENTLSYERIFDFKIKEEQTEIQWLEEATYDVDYNKNGVLAVTMRIDGSGAYPDYSTKPIVVNLKTGAQAMPRDVFVNLDGLAAKVKLAQQAEVKKAIVEIKKEDPEEENPGSLFESTDFTTKNLDQFTVNDKGVTFWYRYGFPHVIQALEPEGRFFFTWAQLKPFIKSGSLLAKFIR